MRVLLAPTEDFIKRERTLVAGDIAAGSSTVITVENSAGLLVNDYIVIGVEGSERAEICKISAVGSATSITVITTLLTHKVGEPIVKYRYNKRKFYGSLTEDGSYSELVSSGSPKTILVTDPQGTFFEYTGNEGYTYFKSTYYNETTGDETSVAEATGTLADESKRYCSIAEIKQQANMTNNPFITDDRFEEKRKQAENEVNSYLYNRYVIPLQNADGEFEVPFIVQNCTKLLAAGYVDYEQFGGDGDGVKWLGEARAILKAVQKGTQRLIGLDGNEFSLKTLTTGIQSYPDQVDNVNGPTQMFTVDQNF